MVFEPSAPRQIYHDKSCGRRENKKRENERMKKPGGRCSKQRNAKVLAASSTMVYPFQLRPSLVVRVELPRDLSQWDVERLHRWLVTLPVGGTRS